MSSRICRTMLRGVDGEQRVSVGLELEIGDGSIRGQLTDGSGLKRAFSGWLALLAALEELSTTGRLELRPEDGSTGGVVR